MKTEYNREPEFSMTYSHIGIQVTFSGKVLAQDFLTISGSDQENEEYLGTLCANALQSASQQFSSLLIQAHSQFDQALAESFLAHVRSRHTPSTNINESENDTAQQAADQNQTEGIK